MAKEQKFEYISGKLKVCIVLFNLSLKENNNNTKAVLYLLDSESVQQECKL
jgi:hypothetical protein